MYVQSLILNIQDQRAPDSTESLLIFFVTQWLNKHTFNPCSSNLFTMVHEGSKEELLDRIQNVCINNDMDAIRHEEWENLPLVVLRFVVPLLSDGSFLKTLRSWKEGESKPYCFVVDDLYQWSMRPNAVHPMTRRPLTHQQKQHIKEVYQHFHGQEILTNEPEHLKLEREHLEEDPETRKQLGSVELARHYLYMRVKEYSLGFGRSRTHNFTLHIRDNTFHYTAEVELPGEFTLIDIIRVLGNLDIGVVEFRIQPNSDPFFVVDFTQSSGIELLYRTSSGEYVHNSDRFTWTLVDWVGDIDLDNDMYIKVTRRSGFW